ncbi:2-hydroxyacid dehydrogenase [Rhodococcus sp. P1Y]|uniref:2-hydroxyacid dehydrogenase n=1 Tax=Rhodococcus sp. P1Y TaxID=1302308 RepID=UPI000EB31892|nr:2-hydroxyacid dehydrogenase [Rhodococcus sp. P1Y]AYJ48974.1 dehydrogenase [Rhodococcus sp. P1Y]
MDTILLLTTDQDDVISRAIESAVGDGGRVVRPAERTLPAVRELLPDSDVVIGDWSGDLPLGPEEAALGPRVKLIQQPGIGVNFIDVDAWSRAGVPVSNAPGGNTESVAEWAVTAASFLNRSMGWADAQVRAGEWPQESILYEGCRELGECRVGIVGFGDIGRRAATLFSAYGCEVSYFSRHERPASGLEYRLLPDLVAASDIVVVAVPLTPHTRNLIGASHFDAMPADSIFVNVARGGVVDEGALIDALATGSIGGAALDVVATEPLPADSRLRTLDNVLLSPHVAGGTSTALRRISSMVAENTARVLRGEPPLWVVQAPSHPVATDPSPSR